MKEAFQPSSNKGMNSRNSHLKLNHLLRRTSVGQKGLSYLGTVELQNLKDKYFFKSLNIK